MGECKTSFLLRNNSIKNISSDLLVLLLKILIFYKRFKRYIVLKSLKIVLFLHCDFPSIRCKVFRTKGLAGFIDLCACAIWLLASCQPSQANKSWLQPRSGASEVAAVLQ